MAPLPSPADTFRRLHWRHGEAELHAFGGMLAPVLFRAAGHTDFSPLQVVPWLRGDWPCVPFGRCDRPDGIPVDWPEREPGDTWNHGYAAHHVWRWHELSEPHTLALQIDLPTDQPVQQLTRIVRALPDAPELMLELHITTRRPCILPVALHPTLRLDLGRVQLALDHNGPGLTYPVPAEPGHSRIAAGTRFEQLDAVPLADGTRGDFTRYPQPSNSEELLQLMQLRGPVTAHYLDAGWSLQLDWDHALLPDLMLWVSHGGRLHAPWNGRHFALGVEPLNGAWDLGRVTGLPADHPLASRAGLQLTPDAPCVIRSRLSARPLP